MIVIIGSFLMGFNLHPGKPTESAVSQSAVSGAALPKAITEQANQDEEKQQTKINDGLVEIEKAHERNHRLFIFLVGTLYGKGILDTNEVNNYLLEESPFITTTNQ